MPMWVAMSPPSPDLRAGPVSPSPRCRMAEPNVTTVLGPLRIGSEVGGKYVVRGLLGRGSYAWVYWAAHREIPSLRVAVKVLRSRHGDDEAVLERFRREAGTAAILQNPHIVRVIDYGQIPEGAPYIVMEYVDGESLDQLLARNGRLKDRLVALLAMHVCEALEEAHARGIMHRDIKPANIAIVRDVTTRAVSARVLDFGIAKVLSPELQAELGAAATSTISVQCTPLYAAPELLRGVASPQADLYALGLTMLEALEGVPPYRADTGFEAANLHLGPAPVPIGPIAAESRLAPICRRATAKRLDERYASAGEMLADLREVFGAELGAGSHGLRLPSSDFDAAVEEESFGSTDEHLAVSPSERLAALEPGLPARATPSLLPPRKLDASVGTAALARAQVEAVDSSQLVPILERAHETGQRPVEHEPQEAAADDRSAPFDELAKSPRERRTRWAPVATLFIVLLVPALLWVGGRGSVDEPPPAAPLAVPANEPSDEPSDEAVAPPAPVMDAAPDDRPLRASAALPVVRAAAAVHEGVGRADAASARAAFEQVAGARPNGQDAARAPDPPAERATAPRRPRPTSPAVTGPEAEQDTPDANPFQQLRPMTDP